MTEGTCKCLARQPAHRPRGAERWLKSGSLTVLRVRTAVMDGLNGEYWKSVGWLAKKMA